MSSCTDGFEELNTDPKTPIGQTDPSFILPTALNSLMNHHVYTGAVNENQLGTFSQYFAKYDYTNENIYDFRGNMFDTHWGSLYRSIAVFRDIARLVEVAPYNNGLSQSALNNRKAVSEIMEIWCFHQLTDQFGDVPYSEAAQSPDIVTPKYDKQSDIYPDLIKRLGAVVESIDTSAEGFGPTDVFFDGDMNRWVVFANSLKLRLAMRLADIDPSVASTAVNEALTAGVLDSNNDNIKYYFNTANAFMSPLRRNDGEAGWVDVLICETFTDVVNEVEDPRRWYMMYGWGPEDKPFNGYPLTYQTKGEFPHGDWGYAFLGWNFRYGDERDYPWAHILIDYAEVEFLKAEAVERGFIGGDAALHYTNAVTASLEYWEVGSDAITTYLSRPDVAYATAEGTWKQKIGTQKYIAFFPQSSEAFAEQRRLDYPALTPPVLVSGQLTQADIATRLPYPISEVNMNPINTTAAIDGIGGENSITTKVWWDVN